jgi:hypothetical protein
MITFSFLYFSNLDLSVTQILLYQIVSYLVSLLILLYYQSRELGFLKNIIYSNWGFSRKQLLDIAKLQAGFISAFLQNYLMVILLGTIGVGLISSYNYSNQLLSIPGQFFLTYFSIIVGVKLNDFATGDFNQNELDVVGLNRVIAGLTILSTIFTVVVSLYFYYNSTDLLKILFSQSGINSATLDNAAIILSILILYIPAAVINILYSRILHISKNVNYASLIQIFFNLLLIVLSFVLSIFWGYQGVIIGVTAGYIIHVYFVLPLLIQRRYPFIRIFKTTMYSALYFLISFIIFYILFSSFEIENIYLRLVNEFFLLSIYFIFSVFLAERFRLISIFSIFPFLSNFNVLKRASR